MARGRRRRWARIAAALLSLLLASASEGCSNEGPPKATAERGAAPAKARVEIVAAPDEDDTAAIVRRELERAKADGRTALVYVGAAWCEPCERFHNAAKAGELDDDFPGLRLIEFDLDRDRERLRQAGYGSKMIPLLALPREDGTGSGAQIEGGLKGEAAVKNLSARLRRLLATRQPEPPDP